MKNYLVTGGAGFIGSNYIHYMLDTYKDIQIVNLDALTYAGNLENLRTVENDARYRFVKADICDAEAVEKIFSDVSVDYVVHFAAESHVDRSIIGPDAFVRTNVLGTLTLLEAARRAWGSAHGKKFVQISTDEVYGSLGETGFFTETTPLDPRSPYSASKAGADLLVKSYFDTYNLPINITRCSNNYGPYQHPEKLIPLMITNALRGEVLPVYGDGLNVRDWLYVGDHVAAIDMVTRNGCIGEVYNIGANNEKRNLEIVDLIIDILRGLLPENDPRREHITSGLLRHVEDRKGHDRRYAIDASKIRDCLAWTPQTSFDSGMCCTIQWYLDNGDWVVNSERGC